ncbi:MAG: heat-shock protein [Euryarchaeota archaeon]|nr:heat-shock protein [Euryarchaeota archaeon]
MSIFLVDMGLGLFNLFSTKSSPLPSAFMLMIFAVMFIGGMVFYERQGLNTLSSLLAGAFAGFGFSFVFVTLVGGVQFILGGGISRLGWEQVISAVAACMIAGIIMIKALYNKLENRFY